MRRLLLLMLAVSLAACGPLDRKPSIVRLPKSPEMERDFQQAEALFLDRRYPGAVAAYHTYLERFPYNYFTPKSHYRLGEIDLVQKRWKEAIPHYRESLKKNYFPEWSSKATYQLAICYQRIEDFKNMFAVLDELPRDSDAVVQVKGASLRVATAKKRGDREEEIKGYLELTDAYTQLPPPEKKIGELAWVVEEKEAYQSVRDWVQSGTADSGFLKGLYKRFKGRASGGYLLWKAARVHHQQGDYGKASQVAERFLRDYPKHEYVPQARLLLAELGKRGPGIRTRIGVLLPLSGEYAVYGESALQGMECAGGIFAPCRGDLGVTLEIRDTQGDPKRAVQLLRELAENPEILAVVGPLTQQESDELAVAAVSLQIPLIALSQKPELAGQGDYVFRNFLTVADQVATLVNHVCREKKFKSYAILYPQTHGGEEYLRWFEKEVGECGGELVAKEGYPASQENFLEPVRALKFSKGRHEAGEKVPFEVLFFPDIYRKVPDLIAAVHFLGLEKVQLLGGAGWDQPGLVASNPDAVEGAIFVNGFFPKSGSSATRGFVSTFQSAYGVEPTLLEAYGYDTLRLIGSVIRGRPGVTRAELKDHLEAVRGFSGVTGEISFDEQGDARRRLFLLTVADGEIREVR